MSRWTNFDLRIDDKPPVRTRKSSSKSASIGGDSKTSKSSSSSAGAAAERPETSDRNKATTHHQFLSNQSNNNIHHPNTSSNVNDQPDAAVLERDPRASIRDDPFFRPYQTAQSARMAEKIRNDPVVRGPDDASKNGPTPLINLVVLGAQGVGKSNFVQRALDLRVLPTAHASAKRMSLDQVIYLVRLIEISLDDIVLSGKGRLSWPASIDGQPMPVVDGVMILYDVTNRSSISTFQTLLSTISGGNKPCVIVSCKCDNPPRARQIHVGMVEELGQSCGGIETYQTSANVPESQKRCISVLLRAILAKRSEPNQSSRSRSGSVVVPESPSKKTVKGKSRASGIFEGQIAEEAGRRKPHAKSDSQSFLFGAEGPFSSSDWETQQPPGSPTSYLLDNALRPSTADSQAHNTFLNMEDDEQSENMSILQDNMSISQQSTTDMASLRIVEKEQNENGNSFDELVDRLLALPMSKAEGKFVPIFLCLYRKFSAPAPLLSAILTRFDRVEKSGEAQLTRVGEQLRYLQILAQWTNEYPGDFAHPSTRNTIMEFVTKLEKSRIFTYAAKEINNYVESVTEDDDTVWAFHDGEGEEKKTDPLSSSTTLVSSKSKGSLDSSNKDLPTESKENLVEVSSRNSGAPSTGSGLGRSNTGSTQSLATLMTHEEASREAQHLNPIPRRRLDKTIWRQFMALPGEEIARELTRIDWIMYSSIRPRDLVRHVSLTADKKDRTKSLENVNRMINHFNHVALFVSSMILLRDKPKHRALALEKFMHIAWKLRQQNNYNSLGSVIAGINGTAIHRLALTRELVPPQVQKEFMRLVILMGTGKSHFAYRLAWENSFSEKIPFLPLHRRDLVAAEDGNRTFVGPNNDRINWKKFEIMGDVIIEIQKSQDRPYPFMQRSDEIQRLVLETKFLEGDEDSIDPYQELYERSVQLEPAGAADAKKSFGWLRGR